MKAAAFLSSALIEVTVTGLRKPFSSKGLARVMVCIQVTPVHGAIPTGGALYILLDLLRGEAFLEDASSRSRSKGYPLLPQLSIHLHIHRGSDDGTKPSRIRQNSTPSGLIHTPSTPEMSFHELAIEATQGAPNPETLSYFGNEINESDVGA